MHFLSHAENRVCPNGAERPFNEASDAYGINRIQITERLQRLS
jgi:hypothetical protein